MLFEAVQHLLIPCPRPLKRLGVLRGLIALQQRAWRCRGAWAPHRQAAAQAARDGMDSAPGRGLAVVYGSGLLLEVPLADLAARFGRVVLVDLFHMPAVRRAVAGFANVELRAHDLGGVMEALTDSLASGRLPPPCPSLPLIAEADFVLSANCLSQIPLDPMAVAWQRADVDDDAVAAWGRALIDGHLAGLAQARGAVTLVTDTRRRRVHARDGTIVDEEDLLLGATLPPLAGQRAWWWDIAPAPEAFARVSVRHHVVAGTLEISDIRGTVSSA